MAIFWLSFAHHLAIFWTFSSYLLAVTHSIYWPFLDYWASFSYPLVNWSSGNILDIFVSSFRPSFPMFWVSYGHPPAIARISWGYILAIFWPSYSLIPLFVRPFSDFLVAIFWTSSSYFWLSFGVSVFNRFLLVLTAVWPSYGFIFRIFFGHILAIVSPSFCHHLVLSRSLLVLYSASCGRPLDILCTFLVILWLSVRSLLPICWPSQLSSKHLLAIWSQVTLLVRQQEVLRTTIKPK